MKRANAKRFIPADAGNTRRKDGKPYAVPVHPS